MGGIDHMKAIAKTRPELGVEIIDAPMPRPGPDQILVRVAACGICGSDLPFTYGNSAPTAPFPGCLPSSAMSRPAKSSNSAPA